MASTAKNTAFMTIASVLQKVIAFGYFTLIAREIGAAGTGKYFFALSFTTIFVVFVDLGLTNVFIRESAKAKEKLEQYLGTVLSVKVVLGVLSYIAVVIVINVLGYELETKHLVYLSGVTMLFDSLHLTLYGAMRALGRLKYEAIGIVGSQAITLVLGSVFLFLHFPLIYLILAFTIPSALNLLYVSIVLKKKFQISLAPHFDKPTFKYMLGITIPFALAAIFARVYSYIDSIILSKLAGDIAVGWYSIPYKITYAFQFIPLALIAALYPKFSELYAKDRERLGQLFQQGLKYLLLISVPIAVGIGVLSKDIILTLYTEEYMASVLPLQILIGSLIFSYLSFPIGAFLNACDKQVTQTSIVGVVMVVNIILNLFLIPEHGVVGAAIAALVGNILLTVLGYFVVPKIVAISHRFVLKNTVQIGLAGFGMGIVVYATNIHIHFLYSILVGAIVYPVFLFVFRSVNVRELREAVSLVKR